MYVVSSGCVPLENSQTGLRCNFPSVPTVMRLDYTSLDFPSAQHCLTIRFDLELTLTIEIIVISIIIIIIMTIIIQLCSFYDSTCISISLTRQ